MSNIDLEKLTDEQIAQIKAILTADNTNTASVKANNKNADDGTTQALRLLGLAPLLRRLPKHDRRTHAVGSDPHQAVHHLCRAQTVFLPQLHP